MAAPKTPPAEAQAAPQADYAALGLDAETWAQLWSVARPIVRMILMALADALSRSQRAQAHKVGAATATHHDCPAEVIEGLRSLLHQQCHTCCDTACLLAECEGHDH